MSFHIPGERQKCAPGVKVEDCHACRKGKEWWARMRASEISIAESPSPPANYRYQVLTSAEVEEIRARMEAVRRELASRPPPLTMAEWEARQAAMQRQREAQEEAERITKAQAAMGALTVSSHRVIGEAIRGMSDTIQRLGTNDATRESLEESGNDHLRRLAEHQKRLLDDAANRFSAYIKNPNLLKDGLPSPPRELPRLPGG
jgi:hypothetical protein